MASGGILRRIGIALGVDVDDKEAKAGIESLKSFATKALGTIAVGVSIAKISSLANEFGAVNKIIKGATRELADQAGVQNKILEAANLTKSSYADTAKVVSALIQENTELFGNVDEAVKFNNAATELFKNAGKTDEQIAGLMESINKSFAKGVVDSETISQLLEQSPEAVALLEKKLGTTKEQFEQLASDGRISLKDLKEAFTDSADEIEKRFLESGVSINDALKNIRNQWGLYVAQVWNGAGISQHVGKLMVRAFNDFMSVLRKAQPTITRALTAAMNWLDKISDGITRVGSFLGRLTARVGGVENAVKLLLIVAGALWLAFHFEKIIGGFIELEKGILKLFDPKNLKTAALIAAITLIVLAAEDFINFMQGNESVIGLLFDKVGIGADKARETIINAFGKVKDFLVTVFGYLRQALKIAVDVMTDFWDTWGSDILSIVSGTFSVIGKIIGGAASLFEKVSGKVKEFTDFLHSNKDAAGLLAVAIGTITALLAAYNAASTAATAVSIGEAAAIMRLHAANKIAAIAKGALTAATGLWTTVAGTATAVTLGLRTAIAFLTSPIGLVILAIGALIAAGVLLYNHWDEVKQWAGELWDGIKEKFYAGVSAVKAFLGEIISFAQDNWQGLLLLLVNPVAGAFKLLYDNCEEFRSTVNSVLSAIKSLFLNIFTAIVTGVREKIGEVRSAVEDGVNKAADFLKGLPAQALEWGRDFIDGFAQGIKEKTQAVIDGVKGVGEKVRSFLHFSRPDTGPLKDYETWMPDFMIGLSEGIDSGSETVIDRVRNMAASIKSAMKIPALGDGLFGDKEYSSSDIIKDLPRAYNALKPKLSSAVSDISLALNVKPSVQTARNAVGANRGGNTVNQNIEINNTVKTEDSKAGRAAAKQLDKSSEDVTKQIANGLAYGRP